MIDDEQDAPTPTDTPAPWPDGIEAEARCEAEDCGKVKPHCIPRLNRPGRPRLCDACHGRIKR
jgi:hypothetical protein